MQHKGLISNELSNQMDCENTVCCGTKITQRTKAIRFNVPLCHEYKQLNINKLIRSYPR